MKVRISLVVALIISFFVWVSYLNFFESFDTFLQDVLFQTGGSVHPQMVIVGLDDESLNKLGRWQDWPRTRFADIINKLSKGKPAVIGIDVEFPDKSGNPDHDAALVNAVKDSGIVVLPVKAIGERESAPDGIEEPFEELRSVAATGHIHTVPDPDNIVRRSLHFFSIKDRKVYSFAYEIAKKYFKSNGKSVESNIPLDNWNSFLIDFTGKPGSFEYYPFYKVLAGEIPVEYFEDKIILIGPYAKGMLDQYMTPIDYTNQMNGVEIHANIIQNFLEQNFKRNAPALINLGFIIALGLLSFLFFLKLKPLFSTITMFLLIIIYAVIGVTAYKVLDLVIYLLYPIMTIFVMYLAVLAYKYMSELLEKNRITGIFGKYVSPEVVKHIIDGGDESLELGGTKKEISVMFVDIRGFTPLSEKVEPDELVNILNEYFNVTVTSIFRFGGTLDKYIGDATMAIFNAPLPLADHVIKAISAALEMQANSAELRNKIFVKHNILLHFGIGINTGNAVVGNIGTKFRMEYTAIGDTVNTAARLESNAKPGEILISATTYELVKDRIQAVFNGEMKLKGKEIPLPVYKVEGILE